MKKANHLRVLLVIATLAVALVAAITALYASTASAQSASDVLKQPPFPPTDTSLFIPTIYTDAPPLVPASSGPTDEATLKQQLSDLLNERFSGSPKSVKSALKVFDSQKTKAIVPDPRLRAALVALKGTAGEAAIAGTLDGTYSTVRFGTTPHPNAVAQVVFPSEGEKPEIIYNERYIYEDFRLFISAMAHEALHQDLNAPNKEELVASSLDSLVKGQILLESPELATSGTELARRINTTIMGRINSRDSQGNLRLLQGTGLLFPGNTGNINDMYWAQGFEPFGDSTPGNKVLKGEAKKVTGKKAKDFDDKTVLLLDSRQRVFTPAEAVQLAQILKLDTSPPSSTTEAQRAQEEAEASEQPVPDWREIFGAE